MATSKVVSVRLDEEVAQAIEDEAKALKLEKSALARNIINAHFNQSTVLVDTMLAEQARQAETLEEMRKMISGIHALLPMIFGMVKTATYSDEFREKMSKASDFGRKIMTTAETKKKG